MQGVSGSAVGSVRGSVSFGDPNPTIERKREVVNMLQEFCGICKTQCPQNSTTEVVDGVSHNEDMRQCSEVE
eukprot:12119624-Karenia_brevis.AAC.1